MSNFFKLDKDHNIILCEVLEWEKWLQDNDNKVKQDNINGYFISTIFLGLDHRFGSEGEPIVFETMVFDQRSPSKDNWIEIYRNRYCTWKEALEGHSKAIEWVKNGLNKKED